MSGPYVTGSGTGFPQTASNRTRLAAATELCQYVGGETRGDALARAASSWDAAVRGFNDVAWKFCRVTQDILLDSTMLDNTTAPSVSRDAGAGIGFVLSTGTAIRYWVEERVKDAGGNIVRRNFAPSSTVATLTGDGSTDKPVITRPATVSSDTTHWALFGTAAGGTYPFGSEIAEVAIATTTIEDTRTGNNPPIPSSGLLYEPSDFSLNSTFRSPKRAFIVDADGLERHRIDYIDYAVFPSVFETNHPAAPYPACYTVRNPHSEGKVIFYPRVRLSAAWPTVRIIYHKFLALAVGDRARLDVPVAVDQAIFDLAVGIIVSRVDTMERAAPFFALAGGSRAAVEQAYRDYPDR